MSRSLNQAIALALATPRSRQVEPLAIEAPTDREKLEIAVHEHAAEATDEELRIVLAMFHSLEHVRGTL